MLEELFDIGFNLDSSFYYNDYVLDFMEEKIIVDTESENFLNDNLFKFQDPSSCLLSQSELDNSVFYSSSISSPPVASPSPFSSYSCSSSSSCFSSSTAFKPQQTFTFLQIEDLFHNNNNYCNKSVRLCRNIECLKELDSLSRKKYCCDHCQNRYFFICFFDFFRQHKIRQKRIKKIDKEKIEKKKQFCKNNDLKFENSMIIKRK
jgi:hypothetical protein